MIARRFLAVFLVSMVLALSFPPAGREKASAQDDAVEVSSFMNSYCYVPGDLAYLNVDLELPGNVRTEEIYLELYVYPSASTRSQLASFRQGMRRYTIYSRTLETISPDSEWTDKMYEIDLKMLGLRSGVYPFETRLLRGGETLASDQNFLVIVDPTAGYPLNLSPLWTMDFLPSYDALGNDLDSGLSSACSSSSSETGFLYNLAKVMKKTPEVHGSIVLAGATYSDLESLAGAVGEDDGDYSKEGASEIITALDDMLRDGQVDIVGTSYAFADLDALASQDWEEFAGEDGVTESDAARQIQLGLDFTYETSGKGMGFVNPLFSLSDFTLQQMVENEVEYTVVGKDSLEASAAGERLLEGTTISQPVRFVNSNGYTLKAFVRDEALYAYLEGTQGVGAEHVVQNILAELAVLQREKPYVVHSCVLAFPPSFVPSQDFLSKFHDAVKGCPWLQTRRLSELNADQFPLEGVALQAPVYSGTPSEFTLDLGGVRDSIDDFTTTIPEDHPLRESLKRSQLIAENYRFTGERDIAAAQAYLGSIEAVIQGEMARVSIELKRSVTLSSTEGKLSVDVTSTLDYPLKKVTLRMENPNLTFPEGNSREVTIEPRENRFIFDVDTRRKGSFIVDIVLSSGNLVIDSTSTTVNTSIINTLAIILLAGLAFIVAMVVVARRLLRRARGGKHSRGRVKE
jgi:hypothetical protein